MKKLLIVVLSAMFVGIHVQAQTENTNETFGSKVSKVWKKTKKGIKDAGTAISDEFSFNKEGEVRVNGTYYMPLYDTNLYHGDGTALTDACREKFIRRYPQAQIQSCVLPQTEWLSEEVKKGDKIVGYRETMYCYIIARDGSNGYINARFVFQSYKEVGQALQALKDKWPAWERTDVIPAKDYQKLLKK
ncbi:MAG: hypothetical protein IJV27_11485 [Prevotella sp.]|nr:hypothetical protein [Prevotella sp.]